MDVARLRLDADRNPDAATVRDRERAAAHVASWLRDRAIPLSGRESDEELVTMLSAVERFETAVATLGGDSMLNALSTTDPENPAFVIPRRLASESGAAYAARIIAAADLLLLRAD